MRGTKRRASGVFYPLNQPFLLPVSARLCSCIKGDALKCKINVDRVQMFDACANASPQPASWRDRIVNATAVIKGTWNTRTQTGLSIEVCAIQLLESKPPICPFQATLGNS